MKLLRILICILLSGFVLIYVSDIEVDNYQISPSIKVEIKGEVSEDKVIEIERGSSLYDVMDEIEITEDADLSSLALNIPLSDNQVVVIPKNSENELISINTADLDKLTSLPGIGLSIGKRIIEYRDLHGCFKTIEEIKNVKGIGDKKYEQIKELICL